MTLDDTSRKGTELLMRTHFRVTSCRISSPNEVILLKEHGRLLFLPIIWHSQMNIFQELSKITAVFYLSSLICHNKEAALIPTVNERLSGAHNWAESFNRTSNENTLTKPQVDDNPGFLKNQDLMLLNSCIYEENYSVRVTSAGSS